MKILPMVEPIIQTYHYDSYPISIMKAHGDEYLKWVLSNYIQLNAFKDIIKRQDVFLEFYGPQGFTAPFLNTQLVLWSAFTNLEININDYIIKHIEQEYYLYFQVDEYYIHNRKAYKNQHYIHDLLIYGYDEEEEIYNVVGYNQDFIYRESTVTFKEFQEAFCNNNIDKEENYWADRIFMFKYKDSNYEFNIDLIKHLLTEYLNSKNTYERYNRFNNPTREKVYGLETYNKVLEHLDYAKRDIKCFKHLPEGHIDNRMFRLIMEHKQLMLMRLEYINKNITDISNIIKEYTLVVKIAQNSILLSIKYEITHSKKILDSLIENIKMIQEKDNILLNDLLKKI